MNRLEEELKAALQREAPSGGFTARVLARVAERERQRQRSRRWFAMPILRWAAAAVIIIAAGGGFEYHRQVQERREGEHAKQQVMLALRITSSKLQEVQLKVQQLNRQREEREQ